MNDKPKSNAMPRPKSPLMPCGALKNICRPALDRIAMLEKALSQAAQDLDWCRSKMPRDAYVFEGKTRLEDRVAEFAAKARRACDSQHPADRGWRR